MRFFDLFTLTANSLETEQALAPHNRIGAKTGVRCAQPQFIVFFPRAIFLQLIARTMRHPKNLTEIPFAPNFSKPDLEVL
jgi:hypothetical protein